jgi:hypothetical protein
MSFQKLVYYSQLGKSHASFKVDLSRTLRCLRENGWRLTGGDKVGSVILEGKGRLYSCVNPSSYLRLRKYTWITTLPTNCFLQPQEYFPSLINRSEIDRRNERNIRN